MDLLGLDKSVEAVLLLLDGGTKNYQLVQSINLQCYHIPSDRQITTLAEALGSKQTKPLCKFVSKARKDYFSMILGVIYKDGLHKKGSPRWAIKGTDAHLDS